MRWFERPLLMVLAAAFWLPTGPVQAEKTRSAWLGVELAPVPAALDAHLDLDRKGLMIRNVFGGSPADKAGLDRYEVIVQADGETVTEQVGEFKRHVRGKQAGDDLELVIYRRGAKKELTVTLEARPAAWAELEFKYGDDPDVAHWRDFGLRGRILRPGQDGWTWEDLDDIPELKERLKKLYKEWTPKGDVPDEVTEGRRIDKMGRVLHVSRLKDGTIEVKRYASADGEEHAEVKTYPNMDALSKGDPEAYDLLRASGPRTRIRRWRAHVRAPLPGFNAPRPLRPTPGWHEWEDHFFDGLHKELRGKGKLPSPRQPEPQVTTRFEVEADGRISVWLREGKTELRRTFESPEAFKTQAPELYERFRRIDAKLR